MNGKAVALVVLVIAVIAGGYFFINAGDNDSGNITNEGGGSNTVSGMRAEENMVVVTEQRPGNTVMASQIHLAAPGYVVIHEDVDGNPGAILGASMMLQAGASSNVKVSLSRPVRDGEKLHAMLHSDTDANGSFSAADQPVLSRLGGPLEGWFEITSDAEENVPVTI